MCLQPASASEELREPAVWQAGDRAHWGAWHQGSTTEVPGDEISQWLEQPSVQCRDSRRKPRALLWSQYKAHALLSAEGGVLVSRWN